jgi:hypothetical protein
MPSSWNGNEQPSAGICNYMLQFKRMVLVSIHRKYERTKNIRADDTQINRMRSFKVHACEFAMKMQESTMGNVNT